MFDLVYTFQSIKSIALLWFTWRWKIVWNKRLKKEPRWIKIVNSTQPVRRSRFYESTWRTIPNIRDISKIARCYGINPNLIRKWKKQLFEGKIEQRLEERQKKLDQAADPPAPDIGGRAGNRKNLSLFEKGRKYHFLMNQDIGSYRIVRSYCWVLTIE
jgi:hypothetical protein